MEQIDQLAKLFYRPTEVAELVSMSRTRIYEAMAAGALRSCKIGASRRIPADALREWAAGLSADGAQASEVCE